MVGDRRTDRVDVLADDPGVFADLAYAGEAVLVEQFDGRGEQETARGVTALGHLGDRLYEPATELGDLVERALQRGPRRTLTAVLLVDVEAGDPPVRAGWGVL